MSGSDPVADSTLEEIQSLLAIYGEDDFVCETAGLAAALESLDAGFLESGCDIRFKVRLGGGADSGDLGRTVVVSCTVSAAYPAELPTFNVMACGSSLSTSTLESLNCQAAVIAAEHADDFRDGAGLFSVFQELAEVISDLNHQDEVHSAAYSNTTRGSAGGESEPQINQAAVAAAANSTAYGTGSEPWDYEVAAALAAADDDAESGSHMPPASPRPPAPEVDIYHGNHMVVVKIVLECFSPPGMLLSSIPDNSFTKLWMRGCTKLPRPHVH